MPNLKQPVYFNDKMLFKKLNTNNPKLKQLVDKNAVRPYIADKIGEEYLIPQIGVYQDPDEVDFKSLPDKFALKPVGGSQHNLICTNKESLDWEESSRQIREWLDVDFYEKTREKHYKGLPKTFVIEEYISDKKGNTYDYKFWCFDGEPTMVQVDTDRFSGHKRTLYDIDFNKIDLKIIHDNHDSELTKPKNYDKMIELAKKLSEGFDFLRVDLYNLDGKIYFGELSIYPDNCHAVMQPKEYEKTLGNLVKV